MYIYKKILRYVVPANCLLRDTEKNNVSLRSFLILENEVKDK